MSIKGLTDKPVIRRDGKIRSGFKETRNGREVPVNTDYFLLHDADVLIPVLGEKPTEIFFTVYFDDINAVAPNDLRWYTKSDLQCLGDADTAAYMGSNEVAGLRQEQGYIVTGKNRDGSPRKQSMPKSRLRTCAYKSCPDYMRGDCSEHIRLDMIIPQYSMGSMFTMENTSINGLLNIIGALDKTRMANIHRGGKVSGEIFRLYKDKVSLPYENPKTGQRSRSDRDVVHMVHVPFEWYEKNYKDKCPPGSWDALMALRLASTLVPDQALFLNAPDNTAQLPPPGGAVGTAAALPPPNNDEEIIRARANDPLVLPLFEELAALLNMPNSEAKRIATAKQCPDVQKLMDRLKALLAAKKKEKAQAQAAEQPAPAAAAPAQAAPLTNNPQAATTAPAAIPTEQAPPAQPAAQAGGIW